MNKLILATVSALALGVAGAGTSQAAGMSNYRESGSAAKAPSAGSSNSTGTHISSPNLGASNMHSPSGAAPGQAQQANLSKAQVRQIQERLHADGLYHGKIDGIAGPHTRDAVAKFQKKNGLRETASLDQQTVSKLLNKGHGSSTSTGIGEGSSPSPSGSQMNGNPQPRSGLGR